MLLEFGIYQLIFSVSQPPGTGKTLFCNALANSLKYNMLQISMSDIIDSYIGKNVIKLKCAFEVARENAPCVLFFGKNTISGFCIRSLLK